VVFLFKEAAMAGSDPSPASTTSDLDAIQHDGRFYPPALRTEEMELLHRRRKEAVKGKGPGDWLSVGLSGGGIRSATFSLGMFEAWARSKGFLRRIDYLSTVSGGGYFGSFLGRLLSRNYLKKPEDLEQVLQREQAPAVLRFLRENGRYMAPNGAGDKLFVGAAVLRNWFSVHLVLSIFLLAFFLGLQVIRIKLGEYSLAWSPELASWLDSYQWGSKAADLIRDFRWTGHGALWWSPYVLIPPVIFLLFAFPLGWAYWLIEPAGGVIANASLKTGSASAIRRWEKAKIPPWAGVLVALFFGIWLPRVKLDLGLSSLWALLSVTAGATLFWWIFVLLIPMRKEPVPPESATRSETPRLAEEIDRALYRRMALRNRLTIGLTWALTATGGFLVLALVDSLGQTMYVLGPRFWGYLAALVSPVLVVVSSAQRIAAFFSQRGSKRGPLHYSLKLIATVAALILSLLLLVTIDAVSHAIAWGFHRPPASAPPNLISAPKEPQDLTVSVRSSEDPVLPIDLQVIAGGAKISPQEAGAAPSVESPPGSRDAEPAFVAFLVALLLSILFGGTWPFVDRSSHHSLYASRLTRAYLGASNQSRWGDGPSITQVLGGDDLDMARYWPPPSAKATPIHLINVTINETVDGRSQVQQQDRKGVGMALGPCGLSVGARHHAVVAFGKDQNADPYGKPCTVYPSDPEESPVFRYKDVEVEVGEGRTERRKVFRGQPLPLGDWVAISGAAFSTGLGAKTSLGVSLLAGFANVRLGRWWDSGVSPVPRQLRDFKLGAWIETRLARWFPVQVCLLDEFLARFPGTARKHWYLSDGGHFENLGGYELIRRRLPLIVIVDAEQDTDFEFGGLANLIRKARLDFGAEIEFLEDGELKKLLEGMPDSCKGIGTIEQLRRGRWENGELKEADRTGCSRAHAALARVRYPSSSTTSRLIYVKPTLMGDEPADVLEYHRSHPDFPHESTADQFFDEAQWESYRRLGDHIARKLLPFLVDGDLFPGRR
jgi:hypothetical protein